MSSINSFFKAKYHCRSNKVIHSFIHSFILSHPVPSVPARIIPSHPVPSRPYWSRRIPLHPFKIHVNRCISCESTHSGASLRTSVKRMSTDGLNSLKYKVQHVKEYPLYTLVSVDVKDAM